MADPNVPAPIPTYTPLGRTVLEGMAWAIGVLLIYAAVDFAANGKLDLRHLRR